MCLVQFIQSSVLIALMERNIGIDLVYLTVCLCIHHKQLVGISYFYMSIKYDPGMMHAFSKF